MWPTRPGSPSWSSTGWSAPASRSPRPIRELRELTRYRKTQIQERSREVQRLDKVLQDAGTRAVECGHRHPWRLGSGDAGGPGRRHPRPGGPGRIGQGPAPQQAAGAAGGVGRSVPHRSSRAAGRSDPALIDYLDETIAVLSARIQQVIAPFAEQVALLDTIPGIDRRAAEVIVAEIVPDMGQFPTAAHLASWAGVCPGNNESAGKHRSGRTRKGSKWLGGCLSEVAKAASRTKGTYLNAQYHRLRGRRGPGKATMAVAHSVCW